jgi:peptidyl-prolyl cis-trans isomerase SurA
MRAQRTIRLVIALCTVSVLGTAATLAQESEPPTRVLLDRVIAVVNNRAILASDLDRELRLAVLEPAAGADEKPDVKSALDRLVSRALIQQQIRREEEQAAEPTDEEVETRITELRAQLPACVLVNCSSEAEWAAFLSANRLTSSEVDSYMRLRLETLAFIENRFRQGIHIAPEEIEAYYNQTLIPQYHGQTAPSLDSVSHRIEEILLQQKVNNLFDTWLDNLRKQGDVEILDSTLEGPGSQSGEGGGGA